MTRKYKLYELRAAKLPVFSPFLEPYFRFLSFPDLPACRSVPPRPALGAAAR